MYFKKLLRFIYIKCLQNLYISTRMMELILTYLCAGGDQFTTVGVHCGHSKKQLL